MAEVELRTYVNEIAGMIEGSSYDVAITHCKHILGHYPKYIEAYRLIGKAALEKEDDATALDIFQRVLAADPEDFVARVGMSIIYDRRDEMDKAIWHMERAFDLMPSNGVIQSELKRLYARRDGVEPTRISLTRGALARMYAQGDLYPEAIADIHQMLQEQPDRIDLQVLLAQVLWRNDQRVEAADWAQKILKQLPYCLTSNLILGEVWQSAAQNVESEVPLKRAQQIDPENSFAAKFFGAASPLPEQIVTIDRLETPYTSEPNMISARLEEVPDWLRGLTDVTAAPQIAGPEAAVQLPTGLHMPDTGPLEAQVPDWLQGLAPATEQEPSAPATEAKPVWLAQMRPAAETPEMSTPVADESTEVPDWISRLGATASAAEPSVSSAQPSSAEEPPDWLSSLGAPTSEAEPGVSPAQPSSAEEMPDWLSSLGAPTSEAEPSVSSARPSSAEEMPDWLKQLGGDSLEPVSAAPETAAEMPDWLANLKMPEIETSAAPAEAEPDWLRSAKGADSLPEIDLSSQAVQPASMEVPNEVPSQDDALAFLTRLSAGKEDQLRAQAEQEASVRMNEIMGRKTTPQIETPAPPPPEIPVSAEVPTEMPSQDDALAFLTRLSAGKEDQLRAQAEQEATARMDVIMGRKQASPLRPTSTAAAQPESGAQQPAAPTVPSAAPTPALSQQEALAFLQKVAADKESIMTQPQPSQPPAPIESRIEPAPVVFAAPAAPARLPMSTGQTAPLVMLPTWWWTQVAEDENEESLKELPEPYRSPRAVAAAAAPVKRERTAAPVREAAAPKLDTAPLVALPAKPSVNVEPLLARLQTNADDHEARLELARAWWSSGNRDQALEHYSALVAANAQTSEALNDLERITEIDDRAAWHRLLGDVYMKTGKLTHALEAYHRALAQL